MSFDAYLKWLGIPPEDQPPDHYRLLGIPTFIADPDVIENAADQRMAHIRSFSTGKHAQLSQRILNELAAAKVTLLHPEKKQTYDDKLRANLPARTGTAVNTTEVEAKKTPQLKSRPLPKAKPLDLDGTAEIWPHAHGSPRQQSAPNSIAVNAPNQRVHRRRDNGPWLQVTVAGVILLSAVGVAIILTKDSPEMPSSSSAVDADRTAQVISTASDDQQATATPASDENPAIPELAVEKPAAEDPMPVGACPPDAPALAEESSNQSTDPPTTETKVTETSSRTEPSPPAKTEDRENELSAETQTKPAASDPRLPIPEPDQLVPARKQVQDVFAELYKTATSLQAKAEAARQLLRQADDLNDGASLYVVFEDARRFALEAGEVELAMEATDRLGSAFQLKVAQSKADTLIDLARQVRDDHQRRALASGGDTMLTELVVADQYASVADVTRIAIAAARRVREPELTKRLLSRGRQAEEIATANELTQQAIREGEDADLATGRFLCFMKGDWETGLPYLARSRDEQLSALAQRELANPATTAEQVSIADTWWKLAAEQNDLAEANLRWHAGNWYEEAFLQATGLEKKRIEKQLAELAASGIAEKLFMRPVDLLGLIDVKRDSIRGAWRFEDNALISPKERMACLQISFEPPRQYDLDIIVSRISGRDALGVGLAGFGGQVLLAIDQSTSGSDNGLDLVDRKPFEQNETNLEQPFLADGKVHRIKISVRRSGITALCDGETVVIWHGDFRRLSIRETWGVLNPKMLFLTGHVVSHRIEKLMLTPVP